MANIVDDFNEVFMKGLILNNINLQRFADDVADSVDNQPLEKNEEVKTYTQDEFDQLTKGLFSQNQVNAIVKDGLFTIFLYRLLF